MTTRPAPPPTGRARLLRRVALVVLFGALGALATVAAATAFWSAPARGGGQAGTGALVAPSSVSAAAATNSSTVSVSWTASHTDSGAAATGYYLLRIRISDNTSSAACGTSAIATTAALGCSDTGVPDGTYRYVVRAVLATWTAASGSSANVTVVNDASKPTVTVTSIAPAPNAAGWNNTGPVVVNLSASTSIGVASLTYSLNSALGVLTLGANVSVSVNAEGVSTISVYATDLLGKVSQTQTVTVRIDRISPAVPSTPALASGSDSGPSSTDGTTNVTTPVFTGTAETGTTVNLYDGTAFVGSSTATTGSYTIRSAVLSAGTRTVTATATDVAGNTGSPSAGTAVTIDTLAPTVPPAPTLSAASDSGSSNSDRLTNVLTPMFTGSAEAGSRVTLSSSTAVVGTAVAAAGGTWSITSTTLKTGPQIMSVTATDLAGNASAASTTTTVTIDYTAPGRPGTPVLTAASDSGRSSSDRITNVATPTLTGSVTPVSTVTMYDGAAVVGTVYAGSNMYSLVTATLAQGSHPITVTATDAAGNTGVASPALTVTVDTTAPDAPSVPTVSASSDTGRSASDGITDLAAPTLVGTTEPNALVTLREGGTAVGTVTTTGTGYSVVPTTLTDGPHPLTAAATDAAGNAGPASPAGTVTVDTVAPAAPPAPTLTAASDTGASSTDRITRVTTPTVTGTAEPNAAVVLYDGGIATGPGGGTAVGGNYTATTGTLTDGSHHVSARATDVAGNVGVASSVTTLLVDTARPTVTINQAAGQPDPTNGTRLRFTVVFSEEVTGFSAGSVTLGGTADATTVAVGNNGPQYDLTVGGMTRAGTVTAAITAARVTDVAGNTNVASTSTDNSVTYAP